MFALNILNNIIKYINIGIGKRDKTVVPVKLQRKKHLPSIYCPRKIALVGFKMETGNGGIKITKAMGSKLRGTT